MSKFEVIYIVSILLLVDALYAPCQSFQLNVGIMGRIFLAHMGGRRLFSCGKCDTNLTNRTELLSTRFTGSTGRAFLFNKVKTWPVNLSTVLDLGKAD